MDKPRFQSSGKMQVQVDGQYDELGVWAKDGDLYLNIEGKIVCFKNTTAVDFLRMVARSTEAALDQYYDSLLEKISESND